MSSDKIATTSNEALMRRLNDAPFHSPSVESWHVICQALDAIEVEHIGEALVDVAARLQGWPERLRKPPTPWLETIVGGQREPRLRLATSPEVNLAIFAHLVQGRDWAAYTKASTQVALALIDSDAWGWGEERELDWQCSIFAALSTVYFTRLMGWCDASISLTVERLEVGLSDPDWVVRIEETNKDVAGFQGASSVDWRPYSDSTVASFLRSAAFQHTDGEAGDGDVFEPLNAADRADLALLTERFVTACHRAAAPVEGAWVDYPRASAEGGSGSVLLLRSECGGLALHAWGGWGGPMGEAGACF